MSLHPDALYNPDGFKEMIAQLSNQQRNVVVPEKYMKIAEQAVARLKAQTVNGYITFSENAETTESMGDKLDRIIGDQSIINIEDLVGENLIFETAQGLFNGATASAGLVRKVVNLGANIEHLGGDYDVIETLYANAIYQRLEHPPLFGLWDKAMAFVESILDDNLNYTQALELRMERECRLAARAEIEDHFSSEIAQLCTLINADGTFIENPGNISDPVINSRVSQEVAMNQTTPFWREIGSAWSDASLAGKTSIALGSAAAGLFVAAPLVAGAAKGAASVVVTASYAAGQGERLSNTKFGKFAGLAENASMMHRTGRLATRLAAFGGMIPVVGMGVAGVSNAIKWASALDDTSLAADDLAAIQLLLIADTGAGLTGVLAGEAASSGLLEAVRAAYSDPKEFAKIEPYLPATVGGLIVNGVSGDQNITTIGQEDLEHIATALGYVGSHGGNLEPVSKQTGRELGVKGAKAIAQQWLELQKNGIDNTVLNNHFIIKAMRSNYEENIASQGTYNNFASYVENSSSAEQAYYLTTYADRDIARHNNVSHTALLYDLAHRGVIYQQLMAQSLANGVSLHSFEQQVLSTMSGLAENINSPDEAQKYRDIPALISPSFFGGNNGFVELPTKEQRKNHASLVSEDITSLYQVALQRVTEDMSVMKKDVLDFRNSFFELIPAGEVTVGQIRYAMKENPVFKAWLDGNSEANVMLSHIKNASNDATFYALGDYHREFLERYGKYASKAGRANLESAILVRSEAFTLEANKIKGLQYGMEPFVMSLESALLMPADQEVAGNNQLLRLLIKRANEVRSSIQNGGDVYAAVSEFQEKYTLYERAQKNSRHAQIITGHPVTTQLAAVGEINGTPIQSAALTLHNAGASKFTEAPVADSGTHSAVPTFGFGSLPAGLAETRRAALAAVAGSQHSVG